MKNKLLRFLSMAILSVFTITVLFCPSPSYGATTGSLKIFSETKGVKLYVDEEYKGMDIIEVKDLEPGDHYVKITKDETVLYSELVKVTAGATAAVLIKSKEVPAEVQKAATALFKQEQEYKQKKLDILLSRTYETVGSSYTNSTYFPGYYYYYWGSGYETTTSTSKQYEVTDWKIIQGGVQEISDAAFAQLVGDKNTLARMQEDWDNYNNIMGWGAAIGVIGLLMVVVGGAAAFSGTGAAADSAAVVFAVGFVPLIAGLGMVGKPAPSGHYVSPGTASKQAFDYNQGLKKQLGLPENFEPK